MGHAEVNFWVRMGVNTLTKTKIKTKIKIKKRYSEETIMNWMRQIEPGSNEKNTKYEIQQNEHSTRIVKILQDAPNYKSATLTEVPSEVAFKKLTNEEKSDIINSMISDGKKRNEIAFSLGISEGRISQLVGKRREQKEVIVETKYSANDCDECDNIEGCSPQCFQIHSPLFDEREKKNKRK